MIVIAILAVLMGLLINFGFVATTTIVFLIGSVAEFSVFAFHLWCGPRRPPRFSKANRQTGKPVPAQSVEAERV
jgi:hypothetical protein